MTGSGSCHGRWRRFCSNRRAVLSLLFLVSGVVGATLLFPFAASWYDVQSSSRVRHGPSFEKPPDDPVFGQRLQSIATWSPILQLGPIVQRSAGWFGYDDIGRSLWFRTLLGWLISLGIGVSAAMTAVVIGVLWGATAGWSGGAIDAVMMRIVDILYGLPYILLVIVLKVVLEDRLAGAMGGRSVVAEVAVLLLAVGMVSWLTMARVVRGQVLTLKRRAFVEAARAGGAGTSRILFRHLLPNLVGPVIVYATLIIPQVILQESFLSFLGIGVQPPLPSLGTLAAEGVNAVNGFVSFWWMLVFPCGALVLTLLALNFVGDGLRDVFDPKSESAAWS